MFLPVVSPRFWIDASIPGWSKKPFRSARYGQQPYCNRNLPRVRDPLPSLIDP